MLENDKVYPAVWYTHCLVKRPVKTFIYKKFPFKSHKSIKIFTKIMAMLHDYILCNQNEYGIQYGTVRFPIADDF